MRSSLLAAGLASLLLGCSTGADLNTGPAPADPAAAIVRDTATVRYFTVEGGFYALQIGTHQVYEPLNLPASFQRDGLPVRFTAKLRTDMGSYRMVGPVVELVRIERR